MSQKFEWDALKAASNFAKHRIRFETAIRIFADPFLYTQQDRIENGEWRWQSIGMLHGHCVILVAHTVTEGAGAEVIRIISARKAEPKERKRYEQQH